MAAKGNVSSKTLANYNVISWRVGEKPTVVHSSKSKATAYNQAVALSVIEGFVVVEKYHRAKKEYEQMIFFGGVLLQVNNNLSTILGNV